MTLSFVQLNHGWNAEPNAPEESAHVDGHDVLLDFYVNPFRFAEFSEDERGVLRFVNCSRFRLGGTNDEGWYRGQCRFSALAPAWGKFYAIIGDQNSTHGPNDWVIVQPAVTRSRVHFLFYFRDRTFECVAEKCVVEQTQDNALFRTSKSIPDV
jgi:hypothetical protein